MQVYRNQTVSLLVLQIEPASYPWGQPPVDEIYGWATTGVGLPQSDLGT